MTSKGSRSAFRYTSFIDPELGKAIPYGIYDISRDEGQVTVGIGHGTAQFAVSSISQWWKATGRKAHPNATRLMITSDSRGSNSARSGLWKFGLQDFADMTGIGVSVSHFSPGTSK